jgi:hypothetical protein
MYPYVIPDRSRLNGRAALAGRFAAFSMRKRSTGIPLSVLLLALVGSNSLFGQETTPARDSSLERSAAGYSSERRAPVLPGEFPVSEIWPSTSTLETLSDIGRGKGIVFSPDLSVPTNRRFYERLGFAYFEDPSWLRILKQIKEHNAAQPHNRIEILILETHGTNGNGLKLQSTHAPGSPRSYLSVGALQEQLEATGIHLVVITACNAGRLFRPQIYKTLNPRTRDPLFLPARLGIVNASSKFNPSKSRVRVVFPANSALETTNEGSTSELPAALLNRLTVRDTEARNSHAVLPARDHFKFVVSDILVQMLLSDPRLQLKSGSFVVKKSSYNFTNRESELLFQKFLAFVNTIALREAKAAAAVVSSPMDTLQIP